MESRVWWCMTVIPTLGSLRQEHCKLKANLNYKRLSQKIVKCKIPEVNNFCISFILHLVFRVACEIPLHPSRSCPGFESSNVSVLYMLPARYSCSSHLSNQSHCHGIIVCVQVTFLLMAQRARGVTMAT
jgi:hypothetical protein